MAKSVNFKCTTVFEKNYGNKSPVIINVGSVRSSKSYSIRQCIIAYALQFAGLKIGIGRKIAATLQSSVTREFIKALQDFGVYNSANYNKIERYYQFDFGDGNPNKSEIFFFGLDDESKLKSTEFNLLWLEEATDFTADDFSFLKTRMSAKKPEGWKQNQIIMSLNPGDARGWIKTWLMPQEGVQVIHSTYKDNPFLPNDYIKGLESLKDTNPMKYKMLVLGEWGVSQGIIFDKWTLYDDEPQGLDGVIYGLDFGFNHATALVQCSFKDNEVYLKELLYKRHITNRELIELMQANPYIKTDISMIADSAEPDRIRDIFDAGFNCLPIEKTTILQSIDTVKKYKIFIHKDSKNLQEEFNNYEWKKNLAGEYLDNVEPNKQHDDGIAAVRYAVQYYDKNAGVSFFDF